MNKLAQIIENLSFKDLNLLKKDLDEGNIHKMINKKLSHEESKIFTCPICGAEVSKDKSFVLEFGKEIRKRAVFDELDCLVYFISKLK